MRPEVRDLAAEAEKDAALERARGRVERWEYQPGGSVLGRRRCDDCGGICCTCPPTKTTNGRNHGDR